jgi:hypothetical protein
MADIEPDAIHKIRRLAQYNGLDFNDLVSSYGGWSKDWTETDYINDAKSGLKNARNGAEQLRNAAKLAAAKAGGAKIPNEELDNLVLDLAKNHETWANVMATKGSPESIRQEDLSRSAKAMEDSFQESSKLARQSEKAAMIRKLGMKIVPKLGAILGGPIGMGIAGASALMDVNDAYALTADTMNPTDSEGIERQKRLAELMRRNEI